MQCCHVSYNCCCHMQNMACGDDLSCELSHPCILDSAFTGLGGKFHSAVPSLKRNSATVETAAAAFDKHIRHVLSETRSLSQILEHLSGAECAAQLQNCQDCPAGRGRHICISQQSTAVLLPLMSLTRTLGTITVNVMAEDVMQVCPLQSSRNESAPVYLLVAEARC